MTIHPIIVLLAVAALAGCGSSESDLQPRTADTTSAAETGAEPAAPSEGNGPDISGRDFDGEALSVADFRGKPVFVNVWSSW